MPRRREKCVEEVKQDPKGAMYLDGEPATRPTDKMQTNRGSCRVYYPKLPTKGPQLDSSMACYEKTNECKSYSPRVSKFSRSADCPCQGCRCTKSCQATGPHCHAMNSAEECVKDYCNYPHFEPLEACPEGNAWSGEVYTDCKWPAPCPAACFDHAPPSDWHGQSRRQLG
ncbi:uncharacterized protein LOC111058915 [Nilaparvata lugens]|uniref:uncharacterized protein LOC111058915 n=1 Tax=Nilaparvata lugens TaxID=108931 RepID=UPI00193CFAE5|nr:uncharacterized protein LOC111058915 [Nilaparvata lugens]